MKNLLTKFFTALIRLYQICISPLFPGCCRFYPTCSQYSLEAIKMHGPYKGIYLTAKRICKCNPFCSGGIDPVPGPVVIPSEVEGT